MKILIIALPGIGNIILATPLIKKLRENFPDAQIDCIVRSETFKAPLEGSKYLNQTLVFPYDPYHKNLKSMIRAIKSIIKLRKKKYDCSITIFPSNQLMYNIFSFLVNSKKRITHSYKIGKLKTLSFLQNLKIPSDKNISDPENNLNLLSPFHISWNKQDIQGFFHLEKSNINFADKFLKKNHLQNKKLLAIHPGTSKRGAWRRWPTSHFIKLIQTLSKRPKIKILIFYGPDEQKTIEKIKKAVPDKALFVYDNNLKNIAALIKRCHLLLSTDSALGHISGVFDIPTIVIFGPANPKRTSPLGKNTKIIFRNLECSPCLTYPFKSLKSDYLKCNKNKICLKQIFPEHILKEIEKRI